MSLQSAMAVLDKANAENPLVSIPGVNPDSAQPVPKVSEEVVETGAVKPVEPEKPSETEKPKEEPKPTEPKEPESKRFAILAKKEKAIYSRAQELKAREEALNQKLAAIENFEKHKREVKNNPMLALQELGISYSDLTEYQLSGKMPNKADLELRELKEEIASFKQQQEEALQKQKEIANRNAQLAVQQTISDFKQEIGDYITSKPKDFELVNLYKANDLVYKTIEDHHAKTQRVMSIQEGAEIVEKYLESEVEKALKIEKLKARVSPQPQADTKQSKSTQEQRATLNNNMTSSAPSFLPAKTEADRIARALAALDKK